MNDSERRVPDPAEYYRREIDDAERKVAGEIDPGLTAVAIAVVVVLLGVSLALPHAGGVRGWQVLVDDPALVEQSIAVTSRLFVWFAVVFGLGMSLLTLLTRRWALSFVTAAGCTVGSVLGVLAIWSRQTLSAGAPGEGPGVGLVAGLLCLVALVFLWLRVVWSRSAIDAIQRQQAGQPPEDR